MFRRADGGALILFRPAGRVESWLVPLLLFVVAFAPRVLALDAFVAPDEGKWIYRSAHFLLALSRGDLAGATSTAATPEVEVLAPAVPTMGTGAVGLLARYWLGGRPAGDLEAYLQAIPAETEKIPLDFYPWTRFPTALLTSLAVALFYALLARLIGSPAALLAVLLMALDPFFLGLSRVIHHDALLAIFIVLSLLSLLRHRQGSRPDRRSPITPWLLLSGLAGGLALLTKPTALVLVLFVALFLLLEGSWRRDRPEWRRVVGEGLAWGLVAGVTFVVLWPAMWVAPLQTLATLLARSGGAGGEENSYSLWPAPGTPLPELGFLFYPINWLFKSTLPAWIGLAAWAVLRQRPPEPPATNGLTPRRTVVWLIVFVGLFLLSLLPAGTRDIRYFLPAALALYPVAAMGLLGLAGRQGWRPGWVIALALAWQVGLVAVYAPYFVDYWNPAAGGPWLAPHLVKIGSGEGLDRVARYLNTRPDAAQLTVATSFWESFVPFFKGRYTKAHYDEEADYILIYLRQIQNGNPFPEYWTYFSARPPELKVSLVGLDYVWLYPGPQLRVVRDVTFAGGLALRGFRLEQGAARPGQKASLSLVWSGVAPPLAGRPVRVRLADETGRAWAEDQGPVLDPAGPSGVEGHYSLLLPPTLPRGDYLLEVAVAAPGGEPAWQRAGTVRVRRLDRPAMSIPVAANFGDWVSLGGADVHFSPSTASASGGRLVEVKLAWQARQAIPRSFTTFAHLVDGAGRIWAQADRIPAPDEIPLPTTAWDRGEWIVDSFRLSLPPDAPAGADRLLVGLYDPETMERLPVVDGESGQTSVEIRAVVTAP